MPKQTSRAAVACLVMLGLCLQARGARGQTFGPEVPVDVVFGYLNSGALVTDRAGTWLLAGSGYAGISDLDILLQRSTDGALSWSPVVRLNTNAATDAGDDRNPSIATDGAGNWVAVWESTDSLGGTFGTDADILVARSTNDGVTWTTPAALEAAAATDTADDRAPQVITDEAGNWLAIWDDLSAGVQVARSFDAGASWTAPLTLGQGATFGRSAPHAAFDGAGHVVAVWPAYGFEGRLNFDVLVARSADGGASWTPAVRLDTNYSTSIYDELYPRIATDGAGSWVTVLENDGWGVRPVVFRSRSTDDGATWTLPVILSTNDFVFDQQPDLTSDGAHTFVGVWGGGAAYSIDAGTTWQPPVVLGTNDIPVLVATDRAGLYVVAYPAGTRRGTVCGDGFVGPGEECDDGNLTAGDGCEPTCTPTGCGDGAVGGIEQCDDGNILPGDCCTPGCQYDTPGAACTDDGNVCTDEACNATGVCQHPANTVACDDGDLCTRDDQCGGGVCAGVAAPRATCHPSATGLGSLLVRGGPPLRHRVTWMWRGAAAAGISARYALCVYDAGAAPQPRLHAKTDDPIGCHLLPRPPNCWRVINLTPRFDYTSAHRDPEGIKYLSMRNDPAGTRIILKGGGPLLATPAGPLGLPVTAQIVHESGECWTAAYGTPIRNDAEVFKAKPD